MKKTRMMRVTRLGVEKLEERDMLSGTPTAFAPFVNPPATGVPLEGGGFPSDVTINPAATSNLALLTAVVAQASAAGGVPGVGAPPIDSGVGQMTIATGVNKAIDAFATCGYATTLGGTGIVN